MHVLLRLASCTANWLPSYPVAKWVAFASADAGLRAHCSGMHQLCRLASEGNLSPASDRHLPRSYSDWNPAPTFV